MLEKGMNLWEYKIELRHLVRENDLIESSDRGVWNNSDRNMRRQ